jgi:predicted RNase H-like HicB family nuclease
VASRGQGTAALRSIRVVFERDETGVWIASVPRVKGCHSYGRTIEQARRRIREAMRLFGVGDRGVAEEVRLPAGLLDTVRRARRARDRAEAQRKAAQAELRAAASRLTRAGLSRRDAGDLLGMSRQRIQQLRSG